VQVGLPTEESREGRRDAPAFPFPFPVGPKPDLSDYATAPWHFLYFLPLPHGHGAFRGTLSLMT
jgi:hypothetical protein